MRCFEVQVPSIRMPAKLSKSVLVLAALMLFNAAYAEDLGVIGPVYAIAERDLLVWIEGKLRAREQSGALAKLMQEASARATNTIEHPQPVADLAKATKARTYYFDPTLVVPYPVTDDAGKILIPAGTTVNPLDKVSLSKSLLFFDARDPHQVRRAYELIGRQSGKVKPILTGGSYMALMRRWKLRIYYDQQGALVRQLGIRAVPALVSQEGRRLRIDELP
jgi:conjugal transfer pilus assembly protein TraW